LQKGRITGTGGNASGFAFLSSCSFRFNKEPASIFGVSATPLIVCKAHKHTSKSCINEKDFFIIQLIKVSPVEFFKKL